MAPEDLSKAERSLWEAFPAGRWVDLRTRDPVKDDPGSADGWSPDRTIRAEVIALVLRRPSLAVLSRVAVCAAMPTDSASASSVLRPWPVDSIRPRRAASLARQRPRRHQLPDGQ